MANKFEGGPADIDPNEGEREEQLGEITYIPPFDEKHKVDPEELKRAEEALKRVQERIRQMKEAERKKKMD